MFDTDGIGQTQSSLERDLIIIIIIFLYPRYLWSRGILEKK